MATNRQIDFIEKLTEQLDLHPMTVLKIAQEIAGEGPNGLRIQRLGSLDNGQASRLITELLEMKGEQ